MAVYDVTYVFVDGTAVVQRVEGEYEDVEHMAAQKLSQECFLIGDTYFVDVRNVNHARVQLAR